MDLSSVDPALMQLLDRIILGVSWAGGALIIAFCFKIGGQGAADFIRALLGKK